MAPRKTHAAGLQCGARVWGSFEDVSPEMVTCRLCRSRLEKARDPLTVHALLMFLTGTPFAEIDQQLVAPAGYAAAAIRQAVTDLGL